MTSLLSNGLSTFTVVCRCIIGCAHACSCVSVITSLAWKTCRGRTTTPVLALPSSLFETELLLWTTGCSAHKLPVSFHHNIGLLDLYKSVTVPSSTWILESQIHVLRMAGEYVIH